MDAEERAKWLGPRGLQRSSEIAAAAPPLPQSLKVKLARLAHLFRRTAPDTNRQGAA